ncbi:MAG: hypothetical protein HC922_05600 [Leptolyngbyaceae cyanobacterium SM2_3_12]|nr:hypothetical protein [Leptolyngbyaceae cyanobacterium SM2_3_12]
MVHAFTVSEQDFKNLDAVEIKMTVSDAQKDLLRALLPTDLTPKKLWVYFFDTPDLQLLNTHQVVLRARSKEDKTDDSTVKLRRVEPDWTFSEWRKAEGEFKVEGDWVSDKLIRSASFSTDQAEGKFERVGAGKDPVDKLFTKEQERFLAEAINTELDFSTLKPLGPIEVYKWKQELPNFDEPMCLEYWQLANPNDVLQEKKEILELSTKVICDRAQIIWEQFNQFLNKHGIDPGAKQAPKTRSALDFFSGLLQTSKFV